MNTPYSLDLKRTASALSSTCSETAKEPVRVFCRIRPLTDENDLSCMSLFSPTLLSIKTPPKYPTQRETRAKFQQVFSSYSTQNEVFDCVAMPLLRGLLKNRNGLLFTYGVTGSGKTFTLSGDSLNPGIMPRCIDTLFNTIGQYQVPKFTVKPDKMNGFEMQSETDAANDRLLESKTGSKFFIGKIGRNQRQYVNDGMVLSDIKEGDHYAVFITYTEIYNNTVFDLLDDSNGKSLQSRILREDCNKNMYVNGVTEVEVKSAEEAFELLNIGQKRKRMGETNLNSDSSRSHSIFNIRLVQIQSTHNGDGQNKAENKMLKVSQLSLVDLAGSERTNRTQAAGMRLKEAGRINNSLMTLRNCIETLRDNQLTGSNKMVPYRDSRLTYLFRSFFEGYGNVQMIVCVNPSIEDYEENLQVMKFAEMTQDVNIKKKEHRDTPYVRKIAQKASEPKPKFTFSFTLPQILPFHFDPDNKEDTKVSLEKIGNVLKQRSEKIESLFIEYEPQEKNFRQKLQDISRSNVLQTAEKKCLKSTLNEERKKVCALNQKIVDIETVNDSLASKNNELLDIIRSLRQQVDEKDLKINQKILEKEKTKRKFATAKENMTHELEVKLRKQREHLRSEMRAKDEKLKKVKEVLESNEAVCVVEPPRTPEALPISEDEIETLHKTPIASSTPARKHRRSRSLGEVWLEHNVIKPVPLDTVLQPCIKKRKAVTALSKAKDITSPKQSKYCLIAQDQDTDGDVETKVYKADIVPTTSGGAQVVFNDVEVLKQISPTATP